MRYRCMRPLEPVINRSGIDGRLLLVSVEGRERWWHRRRSGRGLCPSQVASSTASPNLLGDISCGCTKAGFRRRLSKYTKLYASQRGDEYS